MLNELYTAEKDMASVSRYRLRIDGEGHGVYKSSGLIAPTGSGSTAWLYSARQISPHKVARLQAMFHKDRQDDMLVEEVASKLSEQTKFPIDNDRLFWHCRESYLDKT